jgi:hypothetical protein
MAGELGNTPVPDIEIDMAIVARALARGLRISKKIFAKDFRMVGWT